MKRRFAAIAFLLATASGCRPGHEAKARAEAQLSFRGLARRLASPPLERVGWRWTAQVHMARLDRKGRSPALEEHYLLEADQQGTLHGRYGNDREMGFEFYWKKPRLFFHLAYRPLVWRRADEEDARDEARRIWSPAAQLTRLLAPCVRLAPTDEGRFGLKTTGCRDRVRSLSGKLRLGPAGQVPEGLELKAELLVEGHWVSVAYRHRFQALEEPIAVPPAEPAPVRLRPERDRRALLGTQGPPGWYRGGGPVRWWRRHHRSPGRAVRPPLRVRRRLSRPGRP